mgnify:CR=1 FL=1
MVTAVSPFASVFTGVVGQEAVPPLGHGAGESPARLTTSQQRSASSLYSRLARDVDVVEEQELRRLEGCDSVEVLTPAPTGAAALVTSAMPDGLVVAPSSEQPEGVVAVHTSATARASAQQLYLQSGCATSATLWRRHAASDASAGWRCRGCDLINVASAEKCLRCAAALTEMTTFAPSAELELLEKHASATPYGRKLKSLGGAAQFVSEGAAAAPGSHEYAAAVDSQMRSIAFRDDRNRIEPMCSSGVNGFDGWLALNTSGQWRFRSRQDVRTFLECEQGESITQEFVIDYSRRVHDATGAAVQVKLHSTL